MATHVKCPGPADCPAYFERHVRYEVIMLIETVNKLDTQITDKIVTNALKESFLIHARVLMDFLTHRPKNPNTNCNSVLAIHFDPEWPKWGWFIMNEYQRINEEVCHLSSSREQMDHHDIWRFKAVRNWILAGFRSFLRGYFLRRYHEFQTGSTYDASTYVASAYDLIVRVENVLNPQSSPSNATAAPSPSTTVSVTLEGGGATAAPSPPIPWSVTLGREERGGATVAPSPPTTVSVTLEGVTAQSSPPAPVTAEAARAVAERFGYSNPPAPTSVRAAAKQFGYPNPPAPRRPAGNSSTRNRHTH